MAVLSFLAVAQTRNLLIYGKDGVVTHRIPAEQIGQIKIKAETEYQYVDLGLSVKWATCNVGAAAPEDYGYYFAWGEISPKSLYTPATCTTHKVKLSDINGNSTYDAAAAHWGGSWRMPTSKEADELVEKCTWTWDSTRKGYNVKGPNGNSIFLPAVGYKSFDNVLNAGSVGEYWTSTPHEASSGITDHKMAHFFLFYYNKDHNPKGDENQDRIFYYRSDGRTIRPVCP